MNTAVKPRHRNQEKTEVKDIVHMTDLDASVGRDAVLDQTATVKARDDPLVHVLLRTKATANAYYVQSSGGA